MFKYSFQTHITDTKLNRKRVQVTFTDKQWEIISKMRGSLGETDADLVRNIILAWLSEKSFISEAGKRESE